MKQLDGELIGRLKNPYLIFQLDATAYPGNSGSPLYDVKSGRVIGIINKVFVQGAKEHAITSPSGMTYAIPVRYLKKFMEGLRVDGRSSE
jgi:S1-C subfamily serine protease